LLIGGSGKDHPGASFCMVALHGGMSNYNRYTMNFNLIADKEVGKNGMLIGRAAFSNLNAVPQ
jgi:hypothetical protein